MKIHIFVVYLAPDFCKRPKFKPLFLSNALLKKCMTEMDLKKFNMIQQRNFQL